MACAQLHTLWTCVASMRFELTGELPCTGCSFEGRKLYNMLLPLLLLSRAAVCHTPGDQPQPTQQHSLSQPLALCTISSPGRTGFLIRASPSHPMSAYKDRRIIRMALTPDKQLTLYLAPEDPSNPSSTTSPAAAAAAAAAGVYTSCCCSNTNSSSNA
jgi:hypothetical protein